MHHRPGCTTGTGTVARVSHAAVVKVARSATANVSVTGACGNDVWTKLLEKVLAICRKIRAAICWVSANVITSHQPKSLIDGLRQAPHCIT